MKRALAVVFATGTILAVGNSGIADSLSSRRAAHTHTSEIALEVAGGRIDKENLALVLPEVNQRTVQSGIRLTPLESKGSVESTQGLCDGDVKIAIVQFDVLINIGNNPDCAGKLAVLGAPLYPYLGFMITSYKAHASSFEKMIDSLQPGQVLRVAAGGSGSGGEATIRRVLSVHPSWTARVSIEPDGADTALDKVKDGELDVFFVMDSPKSPLIKEVETSIDRKSGKPDFKFIDFRPSREVLEDIAFGRKVYATKVVARGFWSSTKTISTPATFAVRNDWYQDHAPTVRAIHKAIEDSLASIAAKTGSNPDWANDFVR
jgi:TRAP-type uncharacterized transport system substrate-binding protein